MTGGHRFSEAISEGDGISLVAAVGDLDSAHAAEAEGAEALVLQAAVGGLQGTTGLPVLWRPHGTPQEARDAGADACVLSVARLDDDGDDLERLHGAAVDLGLDCVIEVRTDEELQLALDRIDPEIFLLSAPRFRRFSTSFPTSPQGSSRSRTCRSRRVPTSTSSSAPESTR